MDISTLIGLILSAAAVAAAVWSNPAGLYDGRMLLVVVLGGIGAGIVANPWRVAKHAFSIIWKALYHRVVDVRELIALTVGFAETARREGILALEDRVDELDDEFMAAGVRLAVDGTLPELIQTILETELTFVQERHAEGRRLLRSFGIGWAGFGGVVALGMLALGSESSEACLPVLYGLVLGGLFALFMPWKLAAQSEREALVMRMQMEGITSIQSGDNPRIVEVKMQVFTAPRDRAPGEKPEETKPKPPIEPPAANPEMQQKVKEGISRLSTALEGKEALPKRISFDELLELAPKEDRSSILAAVGEEASYKVPEAPPALTGFDRRTDALFEINLSDLADFSDREIQMVLREVDVQGLSAALLAAGDDVRGRVFANVSTRVGTLLKEKMVFLGPVRLVDIVDVHLRIMHVIQKLRVTGQI